MLVSVVKIRNEAASVFGTHAEKDLFQFEIPIGTGLVRFRTPARS